MGTLKRIAVVGGGLSGLSAALRLSRAGHRVTLYEAGDKLGGCCATTDVQGYRFNDGAMYVALPEIIDRAFDQLRLDREALLPLRKIAATQTTRLPDGTVITLTDGLGVTVHSSRGHAQAADLEQQLAALLARWRPVMDLLSNELVTQPFSAWRLLSKGWRQLPKLRGTVASQLETHIADPALRAALSAVTLYTGLPPERTPAIQLVGLAAMLADRFYMPEGGMGRIPQVLAEALIAQGGEIFVGAKVRRIIVRDGKVRGLDVEGHGSVAADAVISTVSAMATFDELLDAQAVPDAAKKKVARTPLSLRAFSLQLGLRQKIDVPSHFMNVVPFMGAQHELLKGTQGPPRWFSYTVPTVTLPELAPAQGSVIEMFPPIDPNLPLDAWTEDRVEAVADAAVEALQGQHQIDVAVRRVRSPRVFRDDMRLFGGAIYGLSPGAPAWAQFAHRTRIDGLYQAGQTTYPGYGVGPALMSGIFAARALMQTLKPVGW
jgi:phytoene dehydrogenase-like protein